MDIWNSREMRATCRTYHSTSKEHPTEENRVLTRTRGNLPNRGIKHIFIMEKKGFTESESIELIAQMIQTTKNRVTQSDFNPFLVWGYTVTAISIADYILIKTTGNPLWFFLWLVLLIPYFVSLFKRKRPYVVTYIDDMLQNVWRVIGAMFGLTIVAITGIGLGIGIIDFSIMMPLSIIYAGIGTSITGLIIKEKWFIWTPLAGLVAATYMLVAPHTGAHTDNLWNLLFGLSFLIFMVIPAHIVRHKISKS